MEQKQPLMLITSPQNPRIKQVIALRDRKERERAGLMRVEGYEELTLAVESGAQPRTLFFCPTMFRSQEQAQLLSRIEGSGAELIEVSERVFEKIAYRDNPDGWLATVPLIDTRLDSLRLDDQPFLLVVESVEKPGNLGAMLRTADAAGVDGLIAAAPITDWGNPNVVRSSKGALFSVPVAAAPNNEVLPWLKTQGLAIVAATPQATLRYTDANLRGPMAIAVGEEKHGLSQQWLDAADIQVQIPMRGRVNSLNVATAAALLIYEAVRQRSA
jgi:RNA methyltransferase, TrmH family